MPNPIPQVQRFMTTSPHSVGLAQTLAHARQMMKMLQVRHLPVLEGGKLRGLLAERDLLLVETLSGVDVRKMTVEEAMTPSVYSVTPEAPLDEVATVMAEHKYGSVVVMQDNTVVGILTTVDVCRALAQVLRASVASQ